MTDLMRQLTARKVERRRLLAALPVGEKLRMLEEMVAAAKVITATQPPKPTNPVRWVRSPDRHDAASLPVVEATSNQLLTLKDHAAECD